MSSYTKGPWAYYQRDENFVTVHAFGELVIYAREVYDDTLKYDTEDEATLIGEAIKEAEDILRRIDGDDENA